ncbi:hypothetical protein Tco_0690935 [Tanacetum coccineum]
MEKSFGPDFVSFMVENEPTSYREVVTSSEGLRWKEAIKSEIDSILQNHTWELVDLPSSCKQLGYKWILKKMMKADGTIEKYEARPFDMKDMGLPDVILGIKIIQTQDGLVLSQAHYVDKNFNTHNTGDSGLARIPIDTNMYLSKNRGVGVAQLEYSRIIGMLMYLMRGTQLDLAYRYLAVIEGYSDANWISDMKDSRSTSGYVFTLGGATISWKSSKQTVIAKSMMESEFIAFI